MKYHYKRVNYEQLDKNQIVPKGKIVMSWEDWRMVCDYITILEGDLHFATGQTFGSIRGEMNRMLGAEKAEKYYGKEQ